MSAPGPARTRAHCNRCGGNTNHDVIAVERKEYEEDDDDRVWTCFDAYEMLKCRGCEMIRLRYTYKHIGDDAERAIYYPPATARREPAWLTASHGLLELPVNLFPVLSEVYIAVQNDLLQLAAMGIRSLLEIVMRNKVGEQGRFEALVDEFEKAGYLSTRQRGSLDSILEGGHAAIHRRWEPTPEDIDTLLDITEAVIETAYLHEERAKALEGRLPKRPRPV